MFEPVRDGDQASANHHRLRLVHAEWSMTRLPLVIPLPGTSEILRVREQTAGPAPRSSNDLLE